MHKTLALVVACCALVSTPFALAQTQGNPIATPAACENPYQLAKQAYDIHRWKEGPDQSVLARIPAAIGCQDNTARAVASVKKVRERFSLYRHYRQISPFRGFNGRGLWLEWVPIPAAVVDCEGGTWGSHNSSGADGPAQMLGHGQPDVNSGSSARTKVRYWGFVRRLYESSGLSPWTPSSGCWGGRV